MRAANGPKRIGLALSGGGLRAAAFHSGVLRWFAERGLLEQTEHISTVSGGSLFAGLVFHYADMRWPTSGQYLDRVWPNVREVLTKRSLQVDAAVRLVMNPVNWRFLLSRANVVAQSIEKCWGIRATLDELPGRPLWSINGTTAENGRRFRFKGITIGDYEIGYAEAKRYPLAAAMAMSAAFPGGIGPIALDASKYHWHKRESWDSVSPPARVVPEYKKIHLYDGGVYDNLGYEPLFDIGKQSIKVTDGSPKIDYLVVSDAGAQFRRRSIPGPLNPCRLRRIADIGFDQAWSLRVRAFVCFLQEQTNAGMYLQIGSDPRARIAGYGDPKGAEAQMKSHEWLSTDDIKRAAHYRTSLRLVKKADFDLIERHGYETALWNEKAYCVSIR